MHRSKRLRTADPAPASTTKEGQTFFGVPRPPTAAGAFFFFALSLGTAFLIVALAGCELCLVSFLFFSNAGMPIRDTLAERPILEARASHKQKLRGGVTTGGAGR